MEIPILLNYQRACCPGGATYSERSLAKILGA
jgi:hypothetical protein